MDYLINTIKSGGLFEINFMPNNTMYIIIWIIVSLFLIGASFVYKERFPSWLAGIVSIVVLIIIGLMVYGIGGINITVDHTLNTLTIQKTGFIFGSTNTYKLNNIDSFELKKVYIRMRKIEFWINLKNGDKKMIFRNIPTTKIENRTTISEAIEKLANETNKRLIKD